MSRRAFRLAWALPIALVLTPSLLQAQAGNQAIDEEYTRLIAEHLQDDRISTELVNYLPASETVPTPLDFHGRIVGTPDELTYAADIHRYFYAIADASPRASVWSIGKSEEGRDMIMMAIADEATIANLERYKEYLQELTDPRITSDARAKELIDELARPIYWLTSGMHSPENGGPEMLQELAYRLAVDESEFMSTIRNNMITFITPVIEVDGREKQVDTYYYNKDRPEGEARLPLMYWGKYVAHDNNRDAMGQMLQLTKNVNRIQLEWAPTVMHDLHEAVNYLYSSTGTGPYNEAIDAITITEWWMLAENDVLEMTKRDVPGVWTYAFYDGWTPNYMFMIAHTHNAIGRFYEVASYGPQNRTLRVGASTTSREWFRPNPPLPTIQWGPRNNTNIQESAVLFSLKYVADHASLFLDNYWIKNKRSVRKGIEGDVNAWVIPADQRRSADAVDAINELMRQGLEIHQADKSFEVGGVSVEKGDYIARADQPFRTLADMYFSLQQFSLDNPRPYDDTGWTFQLMRNVVVTPVGDPDILDEDMTLLTSPAMAVGEINGRGDILVVDHTTDNNLMAFRFRHVDVVMQAAEGRFELNDTEFSAGSFIIQGADLPTLEASLKELGLSATRTNKMPEVAVHELDVPRIGYVHSWRRTQDEGWVRGALDHYGIPYDYFADQRLRDGGLRAKYDVIIFPHVGGDARSQVNGIAMTGDLPLPYRRTDATPHLGVLDESDDIRGGMGVEGLMELASFVKEGGTLLVEGATANIFPGYGLTSDVTVESPEGLIAPGSIHRGILADKSSPITYGFEGNQLPVFFKNDLVLSVGGGAGGMFARFFGRGGASPWQNTTPMARLPELSEYEPGMMVEEGEEQIDEAAEFAAMARQFGFGGDDAVGSRVIMKFPDDVDQILLSGTLGGGKALEGKAQVVDTPLGDGHIVSFSIRPFWRWQTQGTFFLGFNTILNWNDLDAGRTKEDSISEQESAR